MYVHIYSVFVCVYTHTHTYIICIYMYTHMHIGVDGTGNAPATRERPCVRERESV